MAEFSDNVLMTATVLAYLVAMLVHAADYAFGRQSHIARAAVREPARERELVSAGTFLIAEPVGKVEQADPPAVPQRGKGWLLQLALAATMVAAAVHLATVVTRALAAERMPWGNMYEFVLTVTFLSTLIWLAVAVVRPDARHLGLFVVLVQLMLTGLAQLVLHTPIGPLVPALDSYWFVVHIGSVAVATGLFLVGFAASMMYLLRSGYDAGKRGGLYPYGRLFANAEVVERLSFRLHAFAFPIWTFGVTAGAIWAEASWGRYWGWDPKETWAFISWIVYAAYLHARATPSVSRRATAWVAVVGWLTMLMNLIGVNIFFEGLHSYGGV